MQAEFQLIAFFIADSVIRIVNLLNLLVLASMEDRYGSTRYMDELVKQKKDTFGVSLRTNKEILLVNDHI
jgi:hypothetical protein